MQRIRPFAMALLALAMVLPSSASAVDGLTITSGQWVDRDDRFGVRVAPRWLWQKPLYSHEIFELKGYWEASVAYWRAKNTLPGENKNLWAFAASPMFQAEFSANFWGFLPYVELGIGVAALTEDSLGSQELGSWYHFEDKIGFGLVRPGKHTIDIGYRYFHYSNASIEKPNDGLDFHTLNFTLYF